MGLNAAKPGPDWTLHEIPDDGIQLLLPPLWSAIDLDDETLREFIDAAKDADFGFSEAMLDQARKVLSSGGVFFAADLTPDRLAQGSATNMMVIRQDLKVALPLDFIVQMNLKQLDTLESMALVQDRRVQISAGEAAEITLTMSTTMFGQVEPVEMTQLQYYVVSGKVLYLVAFTTLSDWFEDNLPDFHSIVQSFEFTE